jgi:hypothetical protein
MYAILELIAFSLAVLGAVQISNWLEHRGWPQWAQLVAYLVMTLSIGYVIAQRL